MPYRISLPFIPVEHTEIILCFYVAYYATFPYSHQLLIFQHINQLLMLSLATAGPTDAGN
jgi:hypothetical protein